MNDRLDLEIQYSIDDYVRSLTFIQSRQFIVKYGFIIVPFAMMFLLLVLFLSNPDSFKQVSLYYSIITFAPVLMIVVLFLLLKYFPNPILRWNVRKQFESSPILREKQRISIDEVGIKGQTQLSAGETKWSAIIEATESKDDFFFFISNKFAMFVPKHKLTSEQKALIYDISKRNLGEKAKF